MSSSISSHFAPITYKGFWVTSTFTNLDVFGNDYYIFLSSHVQRRFLIVMIGTTLSSNEIILFEEVGFHLQEQPSLSPRRLSTSSKLFEVVQWTYARPPHAEKSPCIRNGKSICRNEKAPTEDHRNQWESA